VSSMTDMKFMFRGASSFDQTLCGAWKTSTADKRGMLDGSYGRMCTTTSTTTRTADPEEQISPAAVIGVFFGTSVSLCVIITVIVVVCCRYKAKRARQEGHVAVVAMVGIPTQNSIAKVPTAIKTDLHIANVTLGMPPALIESMDVAVPVDVIPVAVARVVDLV